MSDLNNIPKHWEIKRLGDVCEIVSGNTPKGLENTTNKGDSHFYKVSDMNLPGNEIYMVNSNLKLTDEEIRDLKIKTYPQGTIIFPKRGGAILTNKKRILSKVSSFDLNLMGILPNEIVISRFLYYWFQKLDLSKICDGSNVPQINNKNIAPLAFPIPPLPEQQLIVARIEELLSELDNGRQQLLTARQQLKVYRQSLLKAAFEGRLTHKEVKEGELPVGWKIVKVGDVSKCIVPNRDKPKSFTGDIKWVTTPNLSTTTIKLNYREISLGLTEFEVEKYNARLIPVGSVIMTCVGTFGLSAIVEKPIVINQQLHAFIPNELLSPKYLAYCVQYNKSYFEKKSTSTTIQYLNKENCNSMPLPLCPLEEQHFIVSELESKLTVCDKIEETLNTALAQSDTLRQSILKKAFEGQLI